jgi:phospholipase/carboxylesterase
LTEARPLTYESRAAAGEPQGAIVLLHGRASNEHDLQAVIETLDPQRRLIGLTPRGPLSLPPGGRHWYAVRKVGYPDPQTFKATYAILDEWLKGLPELTAVPFNRTVLGGFSQGAVMAYALGLGRGRPSPAAIIALSGFIPTVDGFELDLSARKELMVAIGHGSLDQVIVPRFAYEANERLTAASVKVQLRVSPMAHSVDRNFLADLRPWLEQTITSRHPDRHD